MSLQSTCRRFPRFGIIFVSTSLATVCKNSRVFAGEHMFYFPHDKTLAVDVLVGCFSMTRREAFDAAVGLLDEELFMYGDDVDWCRVCLERRMGNRFLPGSASDS